MKKQEEIEFKQLHQEGIGCIIWFFRCLLIFILVMLFFTLRWVGVL
jgi:hypothetical protein